jgi:hypothetical protein
MHYMGWAQSARATNEGGSNPDIRASVIMRTDPACKGCITLLLDLNRVAQFFDMLVICYQSTYSKKSIGDDAFLSLIGTLAGCA